MTVRDRVRDHRARMRARGYRVIQVWVPDVRSEEFAAEAHRQSLRAAEADRKNGDQDFIDSITAPIWDEE